ncbi:hypothetical protein V6N13_014624 [Hibiscus sabdariffa]|uniref:Uncharacterized protein n=1 Tax=Hibiscus sabdariffa TaxID=183260 RepID=A0ABR2RWF0_9ROSI
MASAGLKVMMIAMVIIMLGHEAHANNCMKDCNDSCDSAWCHIQCEWKCIRSNAASFFGPMNAQSLHAVPSAMHFPSPSPSPSPLSLSSASASPLGQPGGQLKNGMVIAN